MNLKLLKNRNYALYIFGNAVTIIGDDFLTVALSLYMLNISGSAAKFASVVAMSIVPSVLISPIAGSLVDRVNRKLVLICLDLFRGCILITAFIYTLFLSPGERDIFILAFVFGICQSFYSPASSSIIPSILKPDDLVQGNLINSLVTQISKIVAPVLASLLYVSMGIGAVCLVDAISFFLIAFIITFLKLNTARNFSKGILHSVVDGFKLFKDKEILSISLNGMLSHLLILPIFSVGYPYLVKRVLNGTDFNYGTVQTIYTIGTLLTIVTVPYIAKRFKDLQALNLGMFGMLGSLSVLFLLNINSFFELLKANHLAMIMFLSGTGFIFSLTLSTYLVFYSSFIQKKVEPQYLGRFYAVLGMLIGLGGVTGSKIYGAVFDFNATFYPVLLGCIGMILKLLLNLMITDGKMLGENTWKTKSVKK